MNEMLVRLTSRAALAFREQSIEPWQGFQGAIPPFDYQRFLRALLLELREPTGKMLVAACEKAAEEQVRPIPIHRVDAASIWQAMIDEVLK